MWTGPIFARQQKKYHKISKIESRGAVNSFWKRTHPVIYICAFLIYLGYVFRVAQFGKYYDRIKTLDCSSDDFCDYISYHLT